MPAPLGHQIEIDKVIFVTEERLLPPVPPLGDMVWQAGGDDASDSSHGQTVAEQIWMSKIDMVSPELGTLGGEYE
nr:hypothetical protein [Desulfuromonas thiophila]